MIRFGSVCSGIEAASVSFEPLGWKAAWFSEIDDFACKVLKHHWPKTPNLGDMTLIAKLIRAGLVEAPDVFCGGTPCQAFSVAGNRESLDDARGNLSLIFCEIANAVDDIRCARSEPASVIFWENVPGVLSTGDNAFGCFLAELAGDAVALEPSPRPLQGRSSEHWSWDKDAGVHVPKWPDSGVAIGPKRAVAWRVLDAQFFGLAQRRRRVFVIASAREGFNPAEVLLEFDGLRRDIEPSREPREASAGNSRSGTSAREGREGAGVSIEAFRMVAFGEYADDGTASTMKARDYKDATDLAVHVVHGTQDPSNGQENTVLAFRASGQDGFNPSDISPPVLASDGGGSGVPTVAYSFAENSRGELRLEGGDGQITGALSTGGGKPGQGCPTIVNAREDRVIPYSLTFCDANGRRADRPNGGLYVTEDPDTAPTLTLAESSVKVVHCEEVAPTMVSNGDAHSGFRDHGGLVTHSNLSVRRLTPIECARLQGFPDLHCLIPVGASRKIEADMLAYLQLHQPDLTHEQARTLATDAPQYKAYGNSWAIAVIHWIGKRIDAKLRELDAAL